MNRVVVGRAARGLADYLLAEHPVPSVIIGYDHRQLSERFARDTAEIMAGAGVRAVLFPEPLPTPVLAFAIRHLGCAAGVMVTASHNPAGDNGYKVYLGDSSQIAPPVDAVIAAAIAAVERLDLIPRGDGIELAGPEVLEAYLDAAGAVARSSGAPTRPSVVYTPLHGVGFRVFAAAVARAGFVLPEVVASQAEPDPEFGTVSFPNPEEPGAMDLALADAAAVDADLVIAHDPDADRCAVAVRRGDGDHQMLTGDQIGALLADHLLRQGVAGTYASSIVSSSLLGRQAAACGQPWQQTLTGFKWIGKVPELVFGYEEALGYCAAPSISRDKDGITAALLVLELAEQLATEASALLDRLHAIYAEHGWYATGQVAIRFERPEAAAEALDRWRIAPPATFGEHRVTRVDDLAAGYRGLPPTDGLRFELGTGVRLICRPSGTEPKLKCYLEIVLEPQDDPSETERIAAERLVELQDAVRAALT